MVAFIAHADDRDVETHTGQINSLAAEGWQYVGLLCAGPHPYTIGEGIHVDSGGNVLFKRPKR